MQVTFTNYKQVYMEKIRWESTFNSIQYGWNVIFSKFEYLD